MKHCPHCGAENNDEAQYCTKCGELLQTTILQPRTTLTDYLSYAFKTASSNLKIFLPHIILYLVLILFFILFFFNIGMEYAYTGDIDPTTIPSGAVKLFMGFTLIMTIIGILSTPFLQHLYQSAVKQEPVSFTESAKYALSRFLSYLGADLLIGVATIIVMLVWFSVSPPEMFLDYPDIDYISNWTSWIWMILLIPPAIIYYYALNIMTWDDTGLVLALKSSVNFLKNRIALLFILWVILAIVNAIIVKIPLGALLSFIPSVIMDLAAIDIYIHYKTPDENPPEPQE